MGDEGGEAPNASSYEMLNRQTTRPHAAIGSVWLTYQAHRLTAQVGRVKDSGL